MRCLAIALALSGAATAPMIARARTPTTLPSSFWEKVKGSWATTKGAVKEQRGKLTDDDPLAIEGRREQLVGKLQQRYGITRDGAQRQVQAWEPSYQM